MKKTVLTAMVLALLAGSVATAAEELQSQEQKLSYVFGQQVGNSLQDIPADINLDAFQMGLKDALEGEEPRLTQKQQQEVMTAFQQKMQAEQQAKRKAQGKQNLRKGKEFLTRNKKKEGVKTTSSGLQYKVLKKGTGASPDADDTVKVHYRGQLLSGKVFDSSYKREKPTKFQTNRVIEGMTEALQLMQVGGKYRLWIPAGLAYGERGAPPNIGPNATLVFEVELLGVEETKKDAAKTGAAEKKTK